MKVKLFISDLSDIYIKINKMTNKKLDSILNDFLNPTITKNVSEDGMEYDECDLKTGECFTIRSADGLV